MLVFIHNEFGKISMVYFKPSEGRWVLQIGSIKYYVFLCEMGSVNFYALHRVINNDYDLDESDPE